MIRKILFVSLILTSCIQSKNKEEKENPKKEIKNKNRELYFKFLKNLEKTLWSSDAFVKTTYNNGSGWQLIDKNGKYIINSDINFTEFPDTSIYEYALQVVTIDNEFTNKNGNDFKVEIKSKTTDGRTFSIPLKFNYHKTNGIIYSETIHYFEFSLANIVVDYRSCFNEEYSIEWMKDSIVRNELDCWSESFYRQETLWKKEFKSSKNKH